MEKIKLSEKRKAIIFVGTFILANIIPLYIMVHKLPIYIISLNNAIITLYLLSAKERKYKIRIMIIALGIIIIREWVFMKGAIPGYSTYIIIIVGIINIWDLLNCYITYKILKKSRYLKEIELKEIMRITFLKILPVIIFFAGIKEITFKMFLGLGEGYRVYSCILPDFLGYIFVFIIVYILKNKKIQDIKLSSLFFIFSGIIFLFDIKRVGLVNILNMTKSHLEYISIFILILSCILLSAEEFIMLILEDFILTYFKIRIFIEGVSSALQSYIVLDLQLFYVVVMTTGFFLIILKIENKKLVDEVKEKNGRLKIEIDENKEMFNKVNLLIDSMENISFIAEESGKIIYSNKAFDEIIKKKTLWDMDCFKVAIEELRYGKKRREIKINDKIIMFEFFTSEIEKKYFISGVGIDITNMKLVEDKLKIAKENAEEANKAKTSLLARVSHELKTPMNTITGINYLLKETNLNKKQKCYTKKIEKASSILLRMIENILDVSKNGNTKMVFEDNIINLKEFIDNIVLVKEDEIERKGLELKVEIDKNIPEYIISDEFKLQQIVINLIGNAIKFTEKGYIKIKIRTTYIEDLKYNLNLAIEDTGIGIDKEKVNQIFEPFTQEDESITRRYGGTGIGLTICKNIVRGLGGEITVKTIKGEGSKFNVSLEVSEHIYKKKQGSEVKEKKKLEDVRNIEVEIVEKDIEKDIAEDVEEFVNLLKNDIGEAFDKLDIIEEKVRNTKAEKNCSNIRKFLDEFEIENALEEVENLKAIF